MAKKSASQLSAEQEYFRKNNIPFEVKIPKKKKQKVIIEKRDEQGITYGLNSNLKSFGIYIKTISIAPLKPLVFMKDKEIVEKIINCYQEALTYISKPEIVNDKYKIIDHLQHINMEAGICLLARHILSVDICSSWWIEQFKTQGDGYWHTTPEDCDSAKDMIYAISFRLNKLKEILNSIQENE